jgi:hypothetical protein
MTFFQFTSNNADNNIAFGDGGGDIGDIKTRVTALENKTTTISYYAADNTVTINSILIVSYDVVLDRDITITGTLNGINISQIITQSTPAWALLSRLAQNLSTVTVSPDVVNFDGTVTGVTISATSSLSSPQVVLVDSSGNGTLIFDNGILSINNTPLLTSIPANISCTSIVASASMQSPQITLTHADSPGIITFDGTNLLVNGLPLDSFPTNIQCETLTASASITSPELILTNT